ncbi:DUF6318 family protein [Paenarthrobacter sp. UW852]|uniref:DUF6318 family protein n=1 Tax=Paenarthrobacter sp. UW852 TaxID=2951989 RepID=UPI002148859A|nr:DUF6318 family protein [Paenarthrobacter sp. UW852]MCR1163000.1 DUF6318 family protein [Paenarthrobacter sp. UW852]
MSRVSRATFSSSDARTFVVGSVLVLLLGGCQGGSTPSEPPSAITTTTAPPASSATMPAASATSSSSAAYKPADANGKAQNVPVPVMPELAKENSKAGLEAFIGYWYATYSYAIETGDLSSWSEVTDTTNPLAASYVKAIERNYSQGRWIVGGTVTAPTIEVQWIDAAVRQQARVQVVQTEAHYFNADGSAGLKSTPASNIAEAVFLEFQGHNWRVVDNGMIVGQK